MRYPFPAILVPSGKTHFVGFFSLSVREYPVREAMKQMKKDHSLYVAWTARMYLIAPGLMYHALRVAGRLTE
jgi:hypothetical protein